MSSLLSSMLGALSRREESSTEELLILSACPPLLIEFTIESKTIASVKVEKNFV